MTDTLQTPVLISGAGPVGMTLALELARYGVRSILVERNATTTRHPKMDLTNGRSMELFHRLGLESKLRDVGVPRENCFDISWITSFAGHELHRFKYPSADQARMEIAARNDGSQASEPGLRVSQIVIEPVLKTAVDANPLIDVRFGTAFERIVAQDDNGVTSEIRPRDGAPIRVHSQFLAGCDGGGSTVRRELGIEMDGQFEVAGAYMVHFRSTALDVLNRWGIAWHYQSATGTLIAQNDKDTWTLQRWLFPGMDPAQLRPEQLLEDWAGTKFEYEILQANPWAAHFVVAKSYGKDRVVLAGDAAHQFVPTGGYGMNSGIADAIGLAWMLTARIEGWGGRNLLTAHDLERRPTAWWHLQASQRHMGVRMDIGGVFEKYGDLDGAGEHAEARRAAAGAEIAALGNVENEAWGVELGYRYDGSPIIVAEASPPPVDPITYRPSTWPGARLPHVFLADGTRIHDRLGLYFTLVVLGTADTSAIEAAAKKRGVPLSVLRLDRPDLRPIYERNLLLVRPDQHVAWRGDDLPGDLDALLARVTGADL